MMRRIFVLALVLISSTTIVFATVQYAVLQDRTGLGSRARDFVKGELWSNIHFEIDYFADIQPQIVPDKVQVANFLDFVQRYTGKRASAEYQVLPVGFATMGHWDVGELVKLDEQTRGTYSLPFYRLSVHIIYANGLFEPPRNNIAGLSISATTIIVFKGLFAVAQPDAEDAILAHEFGHLLGLCGIVVPDPQNICDGNGHAKDTQSLMADGIHATSTWVQRLELQPIEVAMLRSL